MCDFSSAHDAVLEAAIDPVCHGCDFTVVFPVFTVLVSLSVPMQA